MGAAGFEEPDGASTSRTLGDAEAQVGAASGAAGTEPGAGSRGSAATRDLPSAVPSFLEACANLASAAAARGDFARARELIEKAARVAALRPEPAVA